MGLNFFVGEVQAQASAASVVGQQATQAVGLLQDGINQFLQAPLSGKTYDTAKRYFSVAYAPLKQGVILTSEALTQAHQNFYLNTLRKLVAGIFKKMKLEIVLIKGIL